MLHGAWADAVAHDRTRHGVGRHLSLLRHGCARARHRVSHVRPMPRCARSSASSACSGLTVAFCGARARIYRYDLYDQRGPEVRLYMRVGHLCCMFAWLGYAVGRDQRRKLLTYLPRVSIATAARVYLNAPREGGDSPLWRAEAQFVLPTSGNHSLCGVNVSGLPDASARSALRTVTRNFRLTGTCIWREANQCQTGLDCTRRNAAAG